MSTRSNMYALSVQQWNPWDGCNHECEYCKPSFQRGTRRWGMGQGNCQLCCTLTPHLHPERLDQSLRKTGFMQFIFTCSSGDIASCPTDYLKKIVAVMCNNKDKTFLLQTKDPKTFDRVDFPQNVVLGITLETNHDDLSRAVSKAPAPSERYEVFKDLKYKRKMLTLEPIMQFDLDTMVRWIGDIDPCMVWLGYDSKNTGLPAPDLAQVKELYWAIGRQHRVVILKTIPEDQKRSRRKGISRPGARPKGASRARFLQAKDWDQPAIAAWAMKAAPNSRLAMWILAHGHAKNVKQLNAAAVREGLNDAKGAIVGGINAWAARNDIRHVIVQKRSPGLRRWFLSADHVLGHRLLGHIVTQRGQFGYDPRCAPGGVLPGHAANQLTDFAFDRRSSRFPSSGFPSPIQLESLAVPPEFRFRLNDDERRSPVRPESRQPNPEDPISWTQIRAFDRLLEHRHLLSQCQVLDSQPGFGNEHRSEQQNTRFENAHFRTCEIRKWAILAARRTQWQTT